MPTIITPKSFPARIRTGALLTFAAMWDTRRGKDDDFDALWDASWSMADVKEGDEMVWLPVKRPDGATPFTMISEWTEACEWRSKDRGAVGVRCQTSAKEKKRAG